MPNAARNACAIPATPDLDPQQVWRGKDEQDGTDLIIDAPPVYIQEKVHPKVLVDDLARHTADRTKAQDAQIDLFADFNGIPEGAERTEFYRREQNWTNRLILGDSLKVMASLSEREGLRGKVQMIYLDPPYGIKFNSNFQWSTTSRDVKDGNSAHITLKSIANNAEIDVLYEQHQPAVLAALADLNAALRGHRTPYKVATGGRAGKAVDFAAPADKEFTMPSGEVVSASQLVEWEVPREKPADWPAAASAPLERFWRARIARQKAIDASIAAKAEYEYLYDKPYDDNKTVRVAGPFTVESLSPHRVMTVDEEDRLMEPGLAADAEPDYLPTTSFDQMILEQLRKAGVQQAHKADRITFTALTGWPGQTICAEGVYEEGVERRRAGIFIGPEFGTVTRADLVDAAREAGDAGFDVVIACAFNYDAHAAEFTQLGRIRVLKARMNADLHMAEDLKNTGAGNLFVIFGEPDIEIEPAADAPDSIQVRIHGVDVFDPSSGEVRSDNTDGIAVWFVDTDYNGESFFVRHAYFLGAGDPYKSLKTSLKAEIDEEAWATLNSAVSRPFSRPSSGRIAVKVINHFGDEVMKVVRV